jgi:anaerobic ribonucleoside-triphosphate reductase activating protein
MSNADDVISLLDVCRQGSRALGPGLRYVVWTQGCPFCCPGCISPEGHSVGAGHIVAISSLVADIAGNKAVSGLTVSGGEPFLQAHALLRLLSQLRARRPDLDVIVFTGFKIEQLSWTEAQQALRLIDVLIDGPYVDSLNDGRGLRGSSNQRIHCLTDRLAAHRDDMERGPRSVEMNVADGYVRNVGIPLKV